MNRLATKSARFVFRLISLIFGLWATTYLIVLASVILGYGHQDEIAAVTGGKLTLSRSAEFFMYLFLFSASACCFALAYAFWTFRRWGPYVALGFMAWTTISEVQSFLWPPEDVLTVAEGNALIDHVLSITPEPIGSSKETRAELAELFRGQPSPLDLAIDVFAIAFFIIVARSKTVWNLLRRQLNGHGLTQEGEELNPVTRIGTVGWRDR